MTGAIRLPHNVIWTYTPGRLSEHERCRPILATMGEQDNTLAELHEVFEQHFSPRALRGRTFAWRGVVDARWSLHSSLYRRLWEIVPTWPSEETLAHAEDELLLEAHRWGLHRSERGRLSMLEQLAVLQHYGAPTRLIDITFNAFVGVFFAVEDRSFERNDTTDTVDGRLFAIDVTNRLINENDRLRSWEDSLERPWGERAWSSEWRKKTFAWRPPPFDRRIAAQQGGFLLGGVPKAPMQWPKETSSIFGFWRIEQVRSFISVPLRAHKLDKHAGVGSLQPFYTIPIAAAAKVEIRRYLAHLFGYTHATLFPDYAGFGTYLPPARLRKGLHKPPWALKVGARSQKVPPLSSPAVRPLAPQQDSPAFAATRGSSSSR